MSTSKLGQIASDCIKVGVDTGEILRRQLLDHDYFGEKPQMVGTQTETQIIKLNTRRKLNKLPKITTLLALYNCRRCGFMTMKKECMVTHRDTHNNTKRIRNVRSDSVKNKPQDVYKCSKCKYSSSSKVNLKLHMHIHTKGTPYKCNGCSYAGEELKDLVNHYKTFHNTSSIDCSYSSHWRKQLLEHFSTNK